MFLFKKAFLFAGLMILVYLGGSGTQSSSLMMQGMGFVGLIVALIIFYIFGRMIWKGLGCLPSFLILSAVVLFIMYNLGFFNNGLGGIGQAILKFLGTKQQVEVSQNMPVVDAQQGQVSQVQSAPVFSENFEESYEPVLENSQPQAENFPVQNNQGFVRMNAQQANMVNQQQANAAVQQQVMNPSGQAYGNANPPVVTNFNQQGASANLFETPQEPFNESSEEKKTSGGAVSNMINNMMEAFGSQEETQTKSFDINDYPVVYGSVRVINAGTFEMYGKRVTLFGIDAPDIRQACADKKGQSYSCGKQAAQWLKNWIEDGEIECRIMQQDTKGNMFGACSFGPYDIGAALVNAGWAVSDLSRSDIYYPYEVQAQNNRRGLWQGSFYRPNDWRKLQNRKTKIKVLKPKKRLNGIFG